MQTASNVGGACGADNVRNMWLDHYQALLNSIPGSPVLTVHISKIDTNCNNITFHDQMTINVKEMCEQIKTMPMGKAPGLDNVSNEHFKYANEKLYVFMSLLYSSLLIHGFLPDSMMVTVIAPIIKNKAGNLSDNNYRPIALATVASKLFECLILSRVSIVLTTCANEFGFIKDHFTEMLIIITIKRNV